MEFAIFSLLFLLLLQAVTGGTLWAMDRSTFRRIVLKSAFQKRKMYEALLEKVPLLTSLSVSVTGNKGRGDIVYIPKVQL